MGCWECLVCSVISCNERLAPLFEEVLKLHSLASKHIFWDTSWTWNSWRLIFPWDFTFWESHAKPMSCQWISQCKKNRKWKKSQASLWLEGISSLWASSDHFWFRAFHLQPLNPYILHNLYIIWHLESSQNNSRENTGKLGSRFVAAWQVHDGPEIALASFHGDTNGLLTIPMLSKVGGIWWAIPWWLKLKVIFLGFKF